MGTEYIVVYVIEVSVHLFTEVSSNIDRSVTVTHVELKV
jgi:hypothetical protein